MARTKKDAVIISVQDRPLREIADDYWETRKKHRDVRLSKQLSRDHRDIIMALLEEKQAVVTAAEQQQFRTRRAVKPELEQAADWLR